jgi:hypothetical protein
MRAASLDALARSCRIEAVGLTEHRLCEEARSVIQELADGKIEHDIALTDGWAHLSRRTRQERALEECAKKLSSMGFCDADSYFPSYRRGIVDVARGQSSPANRSTAEVGVHND